MTEDLGVVIGYMISKLGVSLTSQINGPSLILAVICYRNLKSYVLYSWNQVWQEINVEAKHVKDIMKTLESFKLDSTPLKAAQQELPASEEVWSLPVPVERR